MISFVSVRNGFRPLGIQCVASPSSNVSTPSLSTLGQRPLPSVAICYLLDQFWSRRIDVTSVVAMANDPLVLGIQGSTQTSSTCCSVRVSGHPRTKVEDSRLR